MTFKRFTLKRNYTLFAFAALVAAGCGTDNGNNDDSLPPVDSTQSTILNISGEIFSIPSPIQTAFLIKNSGASYSKDILNPSNKSSQYSTNFVRYYNSCHNNKWRI